MTQKQGLEKYDSFETTPVNIMFLQEQKPYMGTWPVPVISFPFSVNFSQHVPDMKGLVCHCFATEVQN